METKKCSVCEIVKPVCEYYKRAKSKDGLAPRCKVCKNESDRVYSAKNSAKNSLRASNWIKNNREKFNARIREYQKAKENSDPEFKMARRIRARLYHALEGNFKKGSAIKSLGINIDEFKKYIEQFFEPGMTWDNYGKLWHIDHTKPLKLFDLQDEEQFKEANHYTNHRPMWKIDNLKKQDTFSLKDKENLEVSQLYDFLKSELNQQFEIKENELKCLTQDLVIRYCNLSLNAEKASGRNLQKDTYDVYKSKNIRLITIFEDEWVNKNDQVKGFLKSIFNSNRKSIGARKCIIKPVNFVDIKLFLNENHLQGTGIGQHYYGIYHNDELIGASVWGKPNVSRNAHAKEGEIELVRYCMKNGIKVIGGLSKTIKLFLKNNPDINKIVSYSDNRWSVGNVYETLGFVKEKEGEPSYWYFQEGKLSRDHRYTWRKHRAIEIFGKESEDDTEWSIMSKNGYDRIWDAGSARWVLTKSI